LQTNERNNAVALRFITKDIHAYVIDYPIAVVLIVAPTTVSNETGMSIASPHVTPGSS
jgi:hypothetical protein